MLCWSTNSNLCLHQISVEGKSVSVEQVEQLEVDGRVYTFTLKGKVVSAARYCSNQFSVVELGSLYFGLLFCEAISRLYHAISYMPPGGDKRKVDLKLADSIEDAELCCTLLRNMQKHREDVLAEFPSWGVMEFHRLQPYLACKEPLIVGKCY